MLQLAVACSTYLPDSKPIAALPQRFRGGFAVGLSGSRGGIHPRLTHGISACMPPQREEESLCASSHRPSRKQGFLPVAAAQSVARRVVEVLFLAYTAVVQVAGAVLGLGLLLNLCGFGYNFVGADAGFVQIRTLAEIRGENAEKSFEMAAQAEVRRLFPSE